MKLEFSKVKPYNFSNSSKKDEVKLMFNDLATKYDFLNKVLSFGIDKYWRRKLVKTITKNQPNILLDIATGTADLAIMSAQENKNIKVIGVDISNKMLELGRRKIDSLNLQEQINLIEVDGVKLPFPDHFFDGVMVAFGVRNFEDLESSLEEIRRVLKPNAKLFILEFTASKLWLIKYLVKFYINLILPIIGFLLSGKWRAYSYLQKSINAFPANARFCKILSNLGYREAKFYKLSLQICSIYTALK